MWVVGMKNPMKIGLAVALLGAVLTACDPESSDESRSHAAPPPMGKAMLMAADSAPMMRSEAASGPRMEIGRNYSIEIDEDLTAQLERDRTECLKLNCGRFGSISKEENRELRYW